MDKITKASAELTEIELLRVCKKTFDVMCLDLMKHCGETGLNEGAADTLRRKLKEHAAMKDALKEISNAEWSPCHECEGRYELVSRAAKSLDSLTL